jgi:hypothetical protein
MMVVPCGATEQTSDFVSTDLETRTEQFGGTFSMMTLEPTVGSASADVLASSTCRPAPAWATSTCIFLFAEYWNALLIVSMGVSEASSP